MTNIYDLANALERGIRELPEYQAVIAAKAKVSEDTAAKELWEKFLAAQTKLQGLVQSGQMPSESDQADMSAIGQQIDGNPILKAYFEAQQALGVYVGDIERIIFKPLEDLTK